MTLKDSNQRFVITLDRELVEKFKKLAQKENRSASNLAAKLIIDYVNEHLTK